MKPKSLLIFLCFLSFTVITSGRGKPTPAPSVFVTLDASSSRKAVSPYIYGKNNSLYDGYNGSALTSAQWQLLKDAGIMMFREGGGNNSTKYNWEKKLSSHPD